MDSIEVCIQKFDPAIDLKPYTETHVVPFTEGITVLDALDYVYEHFDSTLAYRANCRGGQCGLCTLTVDESPVLACETQVNRQQITVAPLNGFNISKDLIFDLRKTEKNLRNFSPYRQLQGPISDKKPSPKSIDARQEAAECIECFACEAACPTYLKDSSSFAGPAVMTKLAEFMHDQQDHADRASSAFGNGVYNCTLCMKCVEVCPKDIDIPSVALEPLRNRILEQNIQISGGQQQLLDSITKNGRAIDKIGDAFLENVPDVDDMAAPQDEVIFFTGCMIDHILQSVGDSILSVLRANKVKVYFAKGQSCSGYPAFTGGAQKLAYGQAKKNVELLESIGVSKVVAGCPECAFTLKEYHAEAMKEIRGSAPRYKVYEFTEYLVDVLGIDRLNMNLGRLRTAFTYHDACYMRRGLRLGDQPRRLLTAIPGGKFSEMPQATDCAGYGGNLRVTNPELAGNIAEAKIRAIKETDVDTCVVECPFCHYHISQKLKRERLPIRILHTAEMLSQSYAKKISSSG